MQILLQVFVFFFFLPFSIVFFCLWLRKSDSFFGVFIVFFCLSTIKGSKCCLSVHVMSLCARVCPLQVVTWTTKKKEAWYKLCSPSSRSPHSQVWAGGLVLVKALFGVSGLLQNCTAALRVAKSPPKLFWREAFQWAGCCRARRRSGVCSKGILRLAGWWLVSRVAGGAAGQTCPFAAGSYTWRSPAVLRWPAPGRSRPGENSPGSSHLREGGRERLVKVRLHRKCGSAWEQVRELETKVTHTHTQNAVSL